MPSAPIRRHIHHLAPIPGNWKAKEENEWDDNSLALCVNAFVRNDRKIKETEEEKPNMNEEVEEVLTKSTCFDF